MPLPFRKLKPDHKENPRLTEPPAPRTFLPGRIRKSVGTTKAMAALTTVTKRGDGPSGAQKRKARGRRGRLECPVCQTPLKSRRGTIQLCKCVRS